MYRDMHYLLYYSLHLIVDIMEVFNGTVERDEHLWKMADSNQDGRLNEEEFLPFQHPEHSTVAVSWQCTAG